MNDNKHCSFANFTREKLSGLDSQTMLVFLEKLKEHDLSQHKVLTKLQEGVTQ
jgi:tRNA-binding EMAP/Myf-like protein